MNLFITHYTAYNQSVSIQQGLLISHIIIHVVKAMQCGIDAIHFIFIVFFHKQHGTAKMQC